MSDNAPHQDDLPELSDEDISLLHQITTLASHSPSPPFRALFAAYDAVFAEQGIEQEHDGVVFRVLLRVGEAAREGGGRAGGRGVDLVGCLKVILQAQGITVVEDEGADGDGVSLSEVARDGEGLGGVDGQGRGGVARNKKKHLGKRRVSFDDARLDETWLSEHSRSVIAPRPRQPGQPSLLAQPARRGRLPDHIPPRRARSTSSQRPANNFTRHSAPKHFQQASPSTVYTSDFDEHPNPTLLSQPSQTQLEQNAEAFASTSAIRTARHCLHTWHDRALILLQTQQQAHAIATAHDSRTLLKQSLDQWRTHLSARKQSRAQDLLHDRQDERAIAHYRYILLRKSFSHWIESATDQQLAIRNGLKHMLQYRYFHRWRTFAVDNALKARSILVRKYLAMWRERLARRQLGEEQAVAKREEERMKRCWRAWFWHFCSRRVEGWRDDNIKKGLLGSWKGRLSVIRAQETTAQHFCSTQLARRTLHVLRGRYAQRQRASQQAQTHHYHTLTTRTLHHLNICARLEPLARTLSLKVSLNLQRKACRIWHLHLSLTRQASEVDRKRILQSAWTSWNDALRCRALGQKSDERVLVEALYRWVLAERLRLFRRTVEVGLVGRALSKWSERLFELRTRFSKAEHVFAEGKQRRSLTFGMVRLHLAMRRREDADRAAVEFASARALPNALSALTTKLREIQQLDKWAQDARFYALCTRTLAIWKEKMTQHQHNRKRDAYARVRARVKIRFVGACLAEWRARTAHLRSLDEAAAERASERVLEVGRRGVGHLRERAAKVRQMDVQASVLNQQKLLSAALSALALRYTGIVSLSSRADAFRRETDLALLAAALKKVQWSQFTAARRVESAEALWARNRDVHVRIMVKHWALQTASRPAARRAAAQEDGGEEEPESPSLRPASRRSHQRPQAFASSPPAATNAWTPAYMRTPSRSRRAGRFRPLPTPAPGTPFPAAFERTYLVTTPAPLPQDSLAFGASGVGNDESVGALTPQVTPFARKLRAGGFAGAGASVGDVGRTRHTAAGVDGEGEGMATPMPALRSSVFGRSVLGAGAGGTAKSVRFAGSSRFGGGSGGHL